MSKATQTTGLALLGIFVCLGFTLLGMKLADGALAYKQMERSVTVKGLSEREYVADTVIWPIQFSAADNKLENIYQKIENHGEKIKAFLILKGIQPENISLSPGNIIDKTANMYGGERLPEFRYLGQQNVTVHSKQIDLVRTLMNSLNELGKQGIAFSNDSYQWQTEYLFTRLNDIKPEMIEEATRNARQVAEKFATDSQSVLGKIRTASQGRFSINARDKNNPHIKKVRVVSTIEYYLSD